MRELGGAGKSGERDGFFAWLFHSVTSLNPQLIYSGQARKNELMVVSERARRFSPSGF
jgi:hypothetical protein